MTPEELSKLVEVAKKELAEMTPEELEDMRESGCNAACENEEQEVTGNTE